MTFLSVGYRESKFSEKEIKQLWPQIDLKIEPQKSAYTWADLDPLLSNLLLSKPTYKTKCFCNIKGGVGKTTLSTQFVMRSSALGYRTLLIDLDPQAHSTQVLGFSKESTLRTIGDVFDGECDLQDVIVQVTPKLSVIPSDMNISTVNTTLDKLSNRERRLARLLEPIKPNYDLIVLDINPAPQTITANAFLASDELCVVTATDLLSVTGIRSLLEIVDDFEDQFEFHPSIRIIPNLYDARDKICNESLGFLKKQYPDLITKSIVRKNTDIKEAQKLCQAIWQYKPNSNGSQDIMALTNELLNQSET